MCNQTLKLEGKTAVVTGGGGVLCRSMALELARNGANIAILDLRPEAAEDAANEVRSMGVKALGLASDVLKRDCVQGACDKVLDTFGKVDILVNGAGGNNPRSTTSREQLLPEDLKESVEGFKTFFDLDAESVQFVFNLNFLGTLLPTQVFAKPMAVAGNGVIVNMSSMNAFRPLTKIPAYSAAKAAVSNFTQWLAMHLAPVGIRVNALAPGFFLTDQNRFLLTDEKTGDLTARGMSIISHTPMARFGVPEDLSGTLMWLVTDASAFVTGIVVPVDGGFSAFSGV